MADGVCRGDNIISPDLHLERPTVYLDQWVWIRLAKVAEGGPPPSNRCRRVAAVALRSSSRCGVSAFDHSLLRDSPSDPAAKEDARPSDG